MDLTNTLRYNIHLSYEYVVWEKANDYEKIPFRCCHFHAYGHLFKDCLKKPISLEADHTNATTQPVGEGFKIVLGQKWTDKKKGEYSNPSSI